LETAELVRTLGCMQRFAKGPCLAPSRTIAVLFAALGLSMIALLCIWPRYCYGLMWIAWFLVVEAVNLWLHHPSLLHSTQTGDWRPVFALALGALCCGGVWERWNYFSSPKWIYHLPGVQWCHFFEMPLLGYLGYLPFGWEVYALLNLLCPRAARLRL
jgi:hypothetical protein